jgi:hypothetical protein
MLGKGQIRLAREPKGGTQGIVGTGEIRFLRDGFAKSGDGIIDPACQGEGDSQIRDCIGEMGASTEGVFVGGNRLLDLSLGHERVTQLKVRLGDLGRWR